MTLMATFGTGQVLWSIVWFSLFFLWIWLLIIVFADLFRSQDVGGWGKALWIIFLIVLPYLGVFVYLIVRGRGMQERDLAMAKAQEQATREYIRSVSGSGTSVSAEIARLAELRAQGTISEQEYQQLKARAMG